MRKVIEVVMIYCYNVDVLSISEVHNEDRVRM